MTRTLSTLHAYIAAVATLGASSVSAQPTSVHRRADLSPYVLAPNPIGGLRHAGPSAPGADPVPAPPPLSRK